MQQQQVEPTRLGKETKNLGIAQWQVFPGYQLLYNGFANCRRENGSALPALILGKPALYIDQYPVNFADNSSVLGYLLGPGPVGKYWIVTTYTRDVICDGEVGSPLWRFASGFE